MFFFCTDDSVAVPDLYGRSLLHSMWEMAMTKEDSSFLLQPTMSAYLDLCGVGVEFYANTTAAWFDLAHLQITRLTEVASVYGQAIGGSAEALPGFFNILAHLYPAGGTAEPEHSQAGDEPSQNPLPRPAKGRRQTLANSAVDGEASHA